MEIIRNANGKTVCHADGEKKTVEIVKKGEKPTIHFLDDGTYDVENRKIEKE